MSYVHQRNYGCRVTEYVYEGLQTVTLENARLRVSVLADKGTDIFEFLYKPLDVDFMWRSPLGVRNPNHFVPTIPRREGAFLDYYEGGWQECLPTGGDPCSYGGTEFGPHGEVCLIPWRYAILADTPEEVMVKFWVRTYRTPFYIEKTLMLRGDEPILHIEERITNEGEVELELFWGHHPSFGPLFLDETCVIDVPARRVRNEASYPTSRLLAGDYDWPMVPAKDGSIVDMRLIPPPNKSAEMSYIYDFEQGWYAITNTGRGVGFGLVWPLEIFPCLWFWQIYGGDYNSPWYGRTYNVALEPFSSCQRTVVKAIEDGSAHKLRPGEEVDVALRAVAYVGGTGVDRIDQDGRVRLKR